MTDKAKDNVENLASRTLSGAEDKASQIKGKMETVGSCIDDMACRAGKEAGELAHSVGQRVSDAADSVASEIRKRPVQSAAIALAIGIVGALFYKRAA